jgi:hypothetical protein
LSIILENISFVYVQADDIETNLNIETANLSNNEDIPDLDSLESN